MPTARMQDDTLLAVTTTGDGPAVLIPVRTAPYDPGTAEQMRAWGADPDLGTALTTGLARAGFRVITADYEGHLAGHPRPGTLTPGAMAADLLAVADAAGAGRFAYYGYSWLALAGLQLALHTDRLTALAMGGYPPLGGPYAAMRTVTRAAHRMALANRDAPPPAVEVQPGDWDAAEVTQTPEQTGQYVTLYESLRDFDERAALDRLDLPRLAFAGEKDNITYPARWGAAYVAIGEALDSHAAELTARGWTVTLLPGADHLAAMQAAAVLPVLAPWLRSALPGG